MYGENNELLYVGQSIFALRRTFDHDDKPWWHEVRHVSFTPLPSRNAALAAEEKAIREEKPKYNIIHSTINEQRPPNVLELSDDIIPQLKKNAENKDDYFAWDSDLSGFGLRIRRGKKLTWIFQTKVRSGQIRKKLGGEELSCKQARGLAMRLKADIAINKITNGTRQPFRGAA
jgi:hypothetical protein